MSPKELFETVRDTSMMLADHTDVVDFQLVGSACFDEENAQDVDFLVLVGGSRFEEVGRWCFGSQWELCAGEYDVEEPGIWGALRKGNANLIVTIDRAWYERAALANEVCVALKLKDKGDRIVVYRVVRDGYDAEDANKRRNGES